MFSKNSINMRSTEALSGSQNSKIHPLGMKSKKLNSTGASFNQCKNATSDARSFCKSVKVGLPISFGVGQSEVVFLLNELQLMKQKYAEMERQLSETCTIEKSIIDNIATSTKNIELRMSRACLEDALNKENQNLHELEKQKEAQIRHCEEIILTLNEATNKINQLQTQNKELVCRNQDLDRQLKQEKNKNSVLLRESSRLIAKIDDIENGKMLIVHGIGEQLDRLRNLKIGEQQYSLLKQSSDLIRLQTESSVCQSPIPPVSSKIAKNQCINEEADSIESQNLPIEMQSSHNSPIRVEEKKKKGRRLSNDQYCD